MRYRKIKDDLFNAPSDYFKVQCISSDFACGAGIAVAFNEHYDIRNRLFKEYPHGLSDEWKEWPVKTRLVAFTDVKVINLITKRLCIEKPTYDNFQEAINVLKAYCIEKGIHKLAMPKIGCGIDRLNWNWVEGVLLDAFSDTDMEIAVYYL